MLADPGNPQSAVGGCWNAVTADTRTKVGAMTRLPSPREVPAVQAATPWGRPRRPRLQMGAHNATESVNDQSRHLISQHARRHPYEAELSGYIAPNTWSLSYWSSRGAV